jgi:hypothetical protein
MIYYNNKKKVMSRHFQLRKKLLDKFFILKYNEGNTRGSLCYLNKKNTSNKVLKCIYTCFLN